MPVAHSASASRSASASARRRLVIDRIAHVEDVDDLQIVADRHEAVRDADEGQGIEAPLEGRLEEKELADEAGGRGDARQREQAQREDGGGERGAPPVAREHRHGMRLRLVPIEGGDRGERAGVRDEVREEVHDDGGERVAAEHDERDRHVTHVRDSGIGEEPLDVSLRQGDDVAERHGDDRQGGDRRPELVGHPVRRPPAKTR